MPPGLPAAGAAVRAGERPAAGAPRRVKVTGDLYHGAVPAGAVYVGRPLPGLPGSKFANPFPLRRELPAGHPLRPFLDAALEAAPGWPGTPPAWLAYRLWLRTRQDLIAAARAELAGTDLACWCKPPPPGHPDWCHAAVLLAVAAAPAGARPAILWDDAA
jgi:hypothetical protein